MPTPPPPEHTRFKPGHKGPGRNPNLLGQAEVKLLIGKMLHMTPLEMEAYIARPGASNIEIMIESTIRHGIKYGDINRFEQLLNRSIGRIKDNDINLNLSKVSDGELLKLAKQAIEVLEQEKPLMLEGVAHDECQENPATEVERGTGQRDSEADEQAPAFTDGPF